MTPCAEIAVSVAEEAAEWVTNLKLGAEFQAILAQTRQSIPDLQELHATLEHNPEDLDDPRVVLHARRPLPSTDDDPTDREWGAWLVTTFPAEVARHFCLLSLYDEKLNAR